MLSVLEGRGQESQHQEILLSGQPPAVLSAILAATLEESHDGYGCGWGRSRAATTPSAGRDGSSICFLLVQAT